MKGLPVISWAIRVAFLALGVLLVLAAACGSQEPARIEGLARVEIGDLVVDAEVPVGEAFDRGLGGRSSLAEGRGMLFVFNEEGRHGFWMKDMLISIDIIWISDEGRVVHMVTADPEPNVPDEQLERYLPDSPARYVLEVRAGSAATKGVDVGDSVELDLP